MSKCNKCNRELTSGDVNGKCGICTSYDTINSIPFLTTYRQTLSTWQCPFCKMVYNELIYGCNCQKLLIEKNDNSKQRRKTD